MALLSRLLSLIVLLSVIGRPIIGAQASPVTADGPTLAETKLWIESEGPGILNARTITKFGTFESSVSDLLLRDCVLSWNTSNGLKAEIPLKDLDVGGVQIATIQEEGVPPSFSLRIKTRAAVGKTINGWYMGKQAMTDAISESVRSAEDGNRLAAAIRRAAVLCGAPTSPF